MSEKGILWTTFNTIIVVLIIMAVLIIGLTLMSEGAFTESFEQAQEESKKIPDMYPKAETLCSEDRLSDERTVYVNRTPDEEYNGHTDSLNKTNVTLGCDIQGTHEVSATCYINHFASWQWVGDGCEVAVTNQANLGYFIFEIPDTTTTRKEFSYPCTGSAGKSHYVFWRNCFERYRYYSDMGKHYSNVNVVLNPVNSTKINVSFWDMKQFGGSLNCFDCEGSEFCIGWSDYDFYGWGVEAKGKVCCPPKEVKDRDGELLLDDDGDAVEETWIWDATLKNGVCCLEESTEREIDYCENLHCEEEDGIWIYGRCWFNGSHTTSQDCDEICGDKEHEDGSPYTCSPPDWERVPENCDIHGLFDYNCGSCQIPPEDRLAPYVNLAGNPCYYQNNPSVAKGEWCGRNGFDRICACL